MYRHPDCHFLFVMSHWNQEHLKRRWRSRDVLAKQSFEECDAIAAAHFEFRTIGRANPGTQGQPKHAHLHVSPSNSHNQEHMIAITISKANVSAAPKHPTYVARRQEVSIVNVPKS